MAVRIPISAMQWIMKCNNTADVYSCHLKGSLLSERSFPLISEWNQGGNDALVMSHPFRNWNTYTFRNKCPVALQWWVWSWCKWLQSGLKSFLRDSYFSSTCATASAFFFFQKDSVWEVSILFVSVLLAAQLTADFRTLPRGLGTGLLDLVSTTSEASPAGGFWCCLVLWACRASW